MPSLAPPLQAASHRRQHGLLLGALLLAALAVACGPEASRLTPAHIEPTKTDQVLEGAQWMAFRQPTESELMGRDSDSRLNLKSNQVASPAGSPQPPPSASPGGRGPAMVRIPAGTFPMGSNDGDYDEKPAHQVSLASFEMDVTEVTTAQYQTCVRAGICQAAGTDDEFCNAGKSDRQDHPINCVSWDDANAFCGWAGRRLPTEEEWEYAARGTDSRIYPWGSTAPGSQLCWNRTDSTCPVGTFPDGQSPFGVQDMAGNVWEWTSTVHCPYSGKSCSGAARVNRGGCWFLGNPQYVGASYRLRNEPAIRNNYLGFRCAR